MTSVAALKRFRVCILGISCMGIFTQHTHIIHRAWALFGRMDLNWIHAE